MCIYIYIYIGTTLVARNQCPARAPTGLRTGLRGWKMALKIWLRI